MSLRCLWFLRCWCILLRPFRIRLHNACLRPRRDDLTLLALVPGMDIGCVFRVVGMSGVEAGTRMAEDIAVAST